MNPFSFKDLVTSRSLTPRFGILLLSLSWLTILYQQIRVAPFTVLAGLWLILFVGSFWRLTPVLLMGILGAILYATPRHLLNVFPSGLGPLSWQETLFDASVVSHLVLHFQWMRAIQDSLPHQREFDRDAIDRLLKDTLGALLGGVIVAVAARYALPFLYLGQELGPTLRLHPLLAGLLTAVIALAGITFLWIAIIRLALRRAVREEEAAVIVNEVIYRDMRTELLRLTRPKSRR